MRSSIIKRGVSLLEVLIAVGVVTIGLFGVLAVIPLAGRQTALGRIDDTKAVHGLSWVEQFHTRGMARADAYWVNPNGSRAFAVGAAPRPVLIDPQFLALNPTATRFPYSSGNALLQMDRITLSKRARHPVNDAAITNMPVLDFPGASVIFQGGDDLSIVEPDDVADPPVQQFTAANTRQSDGRFSWMAMVTPIRGANSDAFRLSVIVVHNRDFSIGAAPANDKDRAEDLVSERTANVAARADLLSAGYRGGAVRITGSNKANVKVARNDWVMLSATSSTGPIYQWYKVTDVDTVPINTAGTWTREIMLQGPDWPLNETSLETPEVTIVTGVVGVYEKTIRLELGQSMWTN